MTIHSHLKFKETVKPQAHERVDEKYFEIVGPTFTNTVGEFRKLFLSEAVCCNIFEIFFNGRKAKIPRRVACKLVSTGLYYACAPADIVPFKEVRAKIVY